jgi:hypothetical protein
LFIGEKKLSRVITPDVMKKPTSQVPKGAQEETKEDLKSGLGGFKKSDLSTTLIGKDI